MHGRPMPWEIGSSCWTRCLASAVAELRRQTARSGFACPGLISARVLPDCVASCRFRSAWHGTLWWLMPAKLVLCFARTGVSTVTIAGASLCLVCLDQVLTQAFESIQQGSPKQPRLIDSAHLWRLPSSSAPVEVADDIPANQLLPSTLIGL